ncbi:hypothetical protein GIB67_034311 [Kingdonia uniflora]|uniref:Uncharacterized protein n=1 Tax=Kingdonia uniflora TaxID=39325 RepID=A0A7J7NRX6_9MAGN|nr:hypothetical protein GIB67_034311 [Kingdonia uniflora]
MDANNDEVAPIDISLLRSFKFHRMRSIALGQVFEKNLLLNLKGFKSLKAGGAGNSLSLKKLRDHYAYKLEKVLNDGTAAKAKKKGLTTKSVARAYMLYILGSFLFPTKRGTDVSARAWGSWTCLPRTEQQRSGHGDKYGGLTLLKFREALEKYKLDDVVWDPYRDKRDFAHRFKEIAYFYGALASPNYVQTYYPNRVARQFSQEQDIRVQKFTIQKYKFGGRAKAKNLALKNIIYPPITSAYDKHKPSKEYDDLLSAHKELKKKLIAKEDFILNWASKYKREDVRVTEKTNDLRKKLVNAEEMKKSLEVNNNEWEVWHQSLKKALVSEGMRDMGDPTFEELFEHNEILFTIAQ